MRMAKSRMTGPPHPLRLLSGSASMRLTRLCEMAIGVPSTPRLLRRARSPWPSFLLPGSTDQVAPEAGRERPLNRSCRCPPVFPLGAWPLPAASCLGLHDLALGDALAEFLDQGLCGGKARDPL